MSDMKVGGFVLDEPVPKLDHPYAFAALRPWVDVGGVGTSTLSWLEEQFHAKPLGRLARPGLFYDFTRYRPTAYFKEGRREVAIPNAVINYAQQAQGYDLLFFHLLEPHMLGEAYVHSVLQVLENLGAKRYCLLGGMYDVVPHTRPLLVSGSSNIPELQERLNKVGAHASRYEGPTTILTLIPQEAAQRNMETMSLVVHLAQYAQVSEDYGGEVRLLELLCSLFGFTLQMEGLRKKAEKQYNEITAAVEKNPQMKQLLQQLELHYDAQARAAQEQSQPPFSRQIEQFLREIDRRFEQG